MTSSVASGGLARARGLARLRTMSRVGIAMLLHSPLKLAGTLSGVVFAVLLTNFAMGTFLGLLSKGTMLQAHAGADLWIVPRGAEVLGQGFVGIDAYEVALGTPGVRRAARLLIGGVDIALSSGRHEAAILIGAEAPYDLGGPWNVVAGDTNSLRAPDVLFFEASSRATLGGIDVGSVREVAGRRTIVGGFTWGLAPFGAPYAYADFETARDYLRAPSHQVSLVLVAVEPSSDVEDVATELRARTSGADIYTTAELERRAYRQMLTKTPIGITFGAISVFGLVVGAVVVGLAMFTSVLDNLREFGTLKALGCTTVDLGLLLLAQSALLAWIGTLAGLSLVAALARALRSPNVGLSLPWELSAITALVMLAMCALASLLALGRVARVEPAMVFR